MVVSYQQGFGCQRMQILNQCRLYLNIFRTEKEMAQHHVIPLIILGLQKMAMLASEQIREVTETAKV